LAGLVLLAYVALEWLFFVTKPSALASLPRATQLDVLARSPLPALWIALAIQAVASAVSVVLFPRFRGVAVAPAATVAGALILLLLDNFTYTIFGFGVMTSAGAVRLVYAAAVPALVLVAGERLMRWTDAAARARWAVRGSVAALAMLAAAPMLGSTRVEAQPDLAAPPDVVRSGGGALPNILVLGIDGVDADALSAYGYERDTTPYLTKLRDESLFFENAFANVGRTHGSLVALLTGRLPFSTHVTFPPTALAGEDARRHLPAILKALGYTSLQLGMRHYADAEDANLLGFDAANYRWQDVTTVARSSGDDEAAVFRRDVAERLEERIGHLYGWRPAVDAYAHVEGRQESPYWKDERRVETLTRYLPAAAEPFFVHAHFLDTHCCSYHPRAIVFSSGDLTRDAFDSQLREADDHVRAVIESLRASGRLERTIVVITSDHTNGWTTKGRVPLLIRFPRAAVTGRVRENVQLVDIAPTLLDYLGQPVPEWMDGISLLDPAARARPRPVFGISEIAGRHSVGMLVTALDDAGPPNYGAGTVTMVDGSRWFELSLADGSMASGQVAGHTAPESPSVDDARARAMLQRMLDAAGFAVAGGS
jgi:arylsulfatase A-like enzyme